MKKLLTVLIALSLVAGGFAAEPLADVNTVDIGGSASVKWGVDLETGKTGFVNDADVLLTLNLLPDDMSASTAGTGVWGELVVLLDGSSKFEVDDNSGNSMTLTNDSVIIDVATIHVNDLYFGITSGDFDYGGDFNYPNAMAYDNGDSVNGNGIYYFEDSPAQEFGYTQGFTAGYNFADMVTVEAAVRSTVGIAISEENGSTKVEARNNSSDELLFPYVAGATTVYTRRDSDVLFPIVNGNWVIPGNTDYDVWTLDPDAFDQAYSNNYALGLSAMITPMEALMIQVAGAYGVTGLKNGDLSMFVGAQYEAPIGAFTLTPVATYNFYSDGKVDGKAQITQNAIGFGVNFGWGEEMDGDSILYGFYDTNLAYVGADEGDGTILPGISLFTSLDLTQVDAVYTTAVGDEEANTANVLPLMLMVHTGDLVPNLSAQALFSTNLGANAAKNAWGAGQDTAAEAMGNATNKMATQVGVAADYDIAVGDLTVTPSAGILFGYTASVNSADEDDTTSGTSVMPRLSVDLAGLVANTTFSLDWDAASFSTGTSTIGGTTTNVDASDLGEISIKAEIAL